MIPFQPVQEFFIEHNISMSSSPVIKSRVKIEEDRDYYLRRNHVTDYLLLYKKYWKWNDHLCFLHSIDESKFDWIVSYRYQKISAFSTHYFRYYVEISLLIATC